MKEKLVRYWKWIKRYDESFPPVVECTKDYIPDGNEHINSDNGWVKKLDDYVDVLVKEEE